MNADMTPYNGDGLKNIIIVYDYAYINGGAAKVAIQSAIGLSSRFNVHYFAAVGPVCDELKNSEVKVECLNQNDINSGNRFKAALNGIWNNAAARSFANLLREYDPENTIVHIHGWVKALSSSVVHISTKCGFKTVITLHDYFTLCPNGGFYNYQKNEICRNHGMSVRCFFCNCDKRSYVQKMWRNIRQMVQDKYVRSNESLAYISISQLNEKLVKPWVKSRTFYRVNNPAGFDCRGVIENVTSSHRYLYIGRVSEEKGIDLFCDALSKAKSTYPELEGIVVGDGLIIDEMKRNHPDILFTGWKTSDEVRQYMLSARALVLPSRWYEGAPLTILEAMSVGLPCIVSDCTSAVELIEPNVNGFIFKRNDANDLATQIKYCEECSNIMELSKMARLCFNKQSCNLKKHVERLAEIYEEEMARNDNKN